MKKIQLLILGISLFLLGSTSVNAQVGVSINIDLQPQWGPAEYDYVEYYYMPEYDIYYYAPQRQFVYLRGTNWVMVNSLPTQYRHVDLYNTYKVVINEPKPYLKNKYYSEHYKQYKGQHSKQSLIRDSKEPKYAKNDYQPAHSRNTMSEKAQQRKMQIQGNQHSRGGGTQHNQDKGGGGGGQHNQGKGNKNH